MAKVPPGAGVSMDWVAGWEETSIPAQLCSPDTGQPCACPVPTIVATASHTQGQCHVGPALGTVDSRPLRSSLLCPAEQALPCGPESVSHQAWWHSRDALGLKEDLRNISRTERGWGMCGGNLVMGPLPFPGAGSETWARGAFLLAPLCQRGWQGKRGNERA